MFKTIKTKFYRSFVFFVHLVNLTENGEDVIRRSRKGDAIRSPLKYTNSTEFGMLGLSLIHILVHFVHEEYKIKLDCHVVNYLQIVQKHEHFVNNKKQQ